MQIKKKNLKKTGKIIKAVIFAILAISMVASPILIIFSLTL